MSVIFEKTTKNFSKGRLYQAKRLFKQWPWMIMAWDDGDIGRYIHQRDYGEYKLIE